MLALVACGEDAAAPLAAAVPQRVVSLAPSLTEVLFALGAGERVVGVTQYCDRPPEAATRKRVADSKVVSLESVASLEPDLILVNSTLLEEALAPLADRIRVQRVPTDSVADMLACITAVGEAVGVRARAREVRDELEAAIERTKQRAGKKRSGGRVLFVIQHDPFFVAGPGSYVDELLRLLGFENAAAGLGNPWPTLSAEALLTLKPEIIVDAALDTEVGSDETGAALHQFWSRFETMPAVRTGRIHLMRNDVLVRPGPGLVEALGVLERVIESGGIAGGKK